MRIRLWAAVWAVIATGCLPAIGASAPPNWPQSLTIGTASPGGVYLVYGRGLAPILSEALGVTVTAQATQGPDQNVLLMEGGEAQLGFVTMGVALQAWNGTGEWTHGKQLRAMRALFPMFDTPFQFFAVADSGIQSLAQMTNKKLGIGPQGGTGGTYLPSVFKALDISVTLRYGAWELLSDQLRSHSLDGMAVTVGAPAPFVAKLDADHAVQFVVPSDKEIAALRDVWDARARHSCRCLPAPIRRWSPTTRRSACSISLWRTRTCRTISSMRIVKPFYANRDRKVADHKSAQESIVDNHKRQRVPAIPPRGGALLSRDRRVNPSCTDR